MQGTPDSGSTATAGHGGHAKQGVAGAKAHHDEAGAAANQTVPVAAPAGNEAVAANRGQLPFTGLSVIALLVVGAALLAGGVMLRIAKLSERFTD